ETRLYNGETRQARSMRTKEESNDYRYFPCPDLLPVVLDEDYIENIRRNMPELPDARRQRFMDQYELSAYDANILASDRATADYFEAVVKQSGEAKLSANWVMGDLAAQLNQTETLIQNAPISAEHLAGLIQRIADGSISSKIAKQVF